MIAEQLKESQTGRQYADRLEAVSYTHLDVYKRQVYLSDKFDNL